MAHHDWSEVDFDWRGLNEACHFFAKSLKRYGRIQITGCKEKYGTMRLEWFHWNGHYNEFLHSIIFPGYLYIKWPAWMRKIDRFITQIAIGCGLCRALSAYQRLIFNIVTLVAVYRWSHLQEEMLDDLDFDALLYRWVKQDINYVCNWVIHK